MTYLSVVFGSNVEFLTKNIAKNANIHRNPQQESHMRKILLSNVKKMELHEKIKFFRLSKNLTQTYLAEQLGIDTGNYSRLERGETKVTLERLSKIAEILETDLNVFLSENELERPSKHLNEILTEILVEIKEINKKLNK